MCYDVLGHLIAPAVTCITAVACITVTACITAIACIAVTACITAIFCITVTACITVTVCMSLPCFCLQCLEHVWLRAGRHSNVELPREICANLTVTTSKTGITIMVDSALAWDSQ